jgi:CO dehydrogenase maturation factor
MPPRSASFQGTGDLQPNRGRIPGGGGGIDGLTKRGTRDILGAIKAEKVKIAITGKGGVGKSTLAALMARVLVQSGNRVVLIDADPDMNLATLLGVPREQSITPIIELKELIAERTGTRPGEPAPFFTMNPRVDDIPEKYSVEREGIKLLVMGTVQRGGAGCACPENAFLKSLLGHLMIARREWVILDMEAGIEHLGRATAQAVTAMIVVVEPGQQSVQTALTIRKLAEEIRIPRLGVVINKVPPKMDLEPIVEALEGLPLLGTLSLDPEIARADLEGRTPYTGSKKQRAEVAAIVGALAKDE